MGVPERAKRGAALSLRTHWAVCEFGFLIYWASSRKTAAEVQSGVIGAVPAEQGVGGDRHVNMVNLGEQLSPFLFCPRDDQCF